MKKVIIIFFLIMITIFGKEIDESYEILKGYIHEKNTENLIYIPNYVKNEFTYYFDSEIDYNLKIVDNKIYLNGYIYIEQKWKRKIIFDEIIYKGKKQIKNLLYSLGIFIGVLTIFLWRVSISLINYFLK